MKEDISVLIGRSDHAPKDVLSGDVNSQLKYFKCLCGVFFVDINISGLILWSLTVV